MPKISIITSAYNAENHLNDCAKSVLNQSFVDFEWILINDGSQDNTAKIITELKKSDHRIRSISQENKGLAAARNIGLDILEGDFFVYLDADDFAHKDWLKIAYEAINEDTNLDFVSFDFLEIPEDYTYRENIEEHVNSEIQNFILHPKAWDNFSSPTAVNRNNWNKIYRTSSLGTLRYVPEIMRGQDVHYGWKIRAHTKTFATIDNKLIYYRINSSGVSRQPLNEKYFESMFLIAKSIAHDYNEIKHSNKDNYNFAFKELAKFIFKVFIKNNKNAHSDELKKNADEYLKNLISLQIFKPKHLSIIKRLKAYIYIKKNIKN